MTVCTPCSPCIFPSKCSLQRGIVWLRPLRSATLSIPVSHWTLLGYPVVALCHEEPAALDQQDQSLHVIQQVIDEVDAGPGQLIALVSGPLLFPGWSIRLFFPIFTTRGSSPAPYQLVQLRNKQQGTGGFCFHAHSGLAHPHLPSPPEPALPCCPGEVQGLLSQVPQLMRGRACPAVTTSGPALPPTTGSGGGRLSFVYTSSLQPNSGASSPRSCSRGPLILGPITGSTLLCCPGGVQGPHSPEWVSPPA